MLIINNWIKYYDKPEGQDPFNKIMGPLRFGIPVSIGLGTMDIFLNSNVSTIKTNLNKLAYWVVPICGMCLAFSSITYVSTKLRKKDDNINYTLGVLGATYVFHTWQKSLPFSSFGALIMLSYALTKKNGIFGLKDGQLFSNHLIIQNDTSKELVRERYRNVRPRAPINEDHYQYF